jgi:hypothetical protein
MHKKSPHDKKTGARIRRQTPLTGRRPGLHKGENPKSISELLSARSALQRISGSIPLQQSWADWLRAAVGAQLAGHIVNAVPKTAELVVFADSAAWGTRLRYALAAMQPDIAARDATVLRTTVRVQRQ